MALVTAQHGFFLLLCAAGIGWAIYLLASLLHDIKRRRPWWREPKRGDVVGGRKRWE